MNVLIISLHYYFTDIISEVLIRRRCYQLILTEDEKALLNGFMNILEPFEMFTIGAQANKYPTLNMELLFRTEIDAKLNELQVEVFLSSEATLNDAIDFLKSRLDHRFPVTDEAVAAAILDPAVQHLPRIDEYLNEKQLTRAELMKKVIEKLNINFSSRVSQHQKRRKSNESNTLKSQLLARHVANIQNEPELSLDSELSLLRSMNDDCDINEFYRDNETRLPCLSIIAKVLLTRPITTSKSESAFSTSGYLINSRRASIDPLRAQKVLFIHDNYEMIVD